MSAKIGIFPASGRLASSIIKHIKRLVPASQLILVARHPDKLAAESRQGAVVRKADYDDPPTLERAFDNVGILMLISYASFEIEHRIRVHERAIDAARRSGVKHIFYSSLAFGGDLTDHSVAHVMGAHLATERYLANLPGRFTYTAIREGVYSESYPMYMGGFDIQQAQHSDPSDNKNDEIAIPHDGSGPGIAWAKRDELGEATAKMIVHCATDQMGFPYLNRVVLLSGPREVSLRESVETIAGVLLPPGREIRIRQVSVDEFVELPWSRRALSCRGVNLAREWATAWDAIRRGECAVVSPVLENVLGREPEDFAVTIRNLVGGCGS